MAKVKPVPDGFHTLTPHLIVRGAAQAIDFYKAAFGAEELSRHPGPDGKTIMHALLRIGDSMLMLADEFPGKGCTSPATVGGTSVVLNLYVNDADALYQRAVKAGAKATMPMTDMFWGDRYGQLSDPFGHQWSLATHKEDVSDAELEKRAKAMFAGKH